MLTNDELSLECQVLKIYKHVIQNWNMRQEIFMDKLEANVSFFLITLLIWRRKSEIGEGDVNSKVCYAEKNAVS